jgi:hypothetical protein
MSTPKPSVARAQGATAQEIAEDWRNRQIRDGKKVRDDWREMIQKELDQNVAKGTMRKEGNRYIFQKDAAMEQMDARRRKIDVEGIAKLLHEDPSLANALTQEERLTMIEHNHIEAADQNLARMYIEHQETVKQQGGVCSLCRAPFEGIGHNAAPFPGRCCDACQQSKVLPARMKRVHEGANPRALSEEKPYEPMSEAEWRRLNPPLDVLDILKPKPEAQDLRASKFPGSTPQEIVESMVEKRRQRGDVTASVEQLEPQVTHSLEAMVDQGVAQRTERGGYALTEKGIEMERHARQRQAAGVQVHDLRERKRELLMPGAEGLEQVVKMILDPTGKNPLTKKDGHLLEEVTGGVADAYGRFGMPVPDNLQARVLLELEKAVTTGAARKLPDGGYVLNPKTPDLAVTSEYFAGQGEKGSGHLTHGNQIVRPHWGPGADELPSLKEMEEAKLLPSSIPQMVEQAMEIECPDLLRKFYPRIYENVGRYHSPRQCAAFLANVTFETSRLGRERSPTSYQLIIPMLEPMAQRGMPMFFIAPDLLKAIERTDFYDDIDWRKDHLKLPFDQGIFILPKGAFAHPQDGDVSMILWGRFEKGKEYPGPVPHMATILTHDGFTLLGLTHKTGVWYNSVFNADVRPTVRLNNLFYRESMDEPTPPSLKTTRLDSDLTKADEEFLEKLGVITFGTFLAMNAKPELLEKGKLLKRVQKTGQQPREFWSPNIIGPRYRLKREVRKIDKHGKFVADQPKRDLGGTHASPRLHWRRGHFRNQAYGMGLKERKQIWIEPMLIGAEGDEK